MAEGTEEFGAEDDWYSWDISNGSMNNWTVRFQKTERYKTPLFHEIKICIITYYVIMAVLGLVGNSLIIIPFIRSPALRRVTSNFFIVHMAIINITDILCFYPPLVQIVVGEIGGKVGLPGNNYSRCLLVKVCFDMLFLDPGLFSMLCVAVNQCLLIASPHKVYRRCCTRKSVAAVLVAYWASLFVKAGLLIEYLKVTTEPQCQAKGFKNRWMYDVDWFFLVLFNLIPTVVIPICHATILLITRASRKRAKSESTRQANTISMVVDGESRVPNEPTNSSRGGRKRFALSEISMATSVSLAPLSEVEPNIPCCSYGTSGSDIVISRPDDVEVKTYDSNENSAPQKRSLSKGLTRHLSTLKLTRLSSKNGVVNVVNAQRSNHGPGKAEVRLIKMMIAMYVILVATWIASLSTTLKLGNWFVGFILITMGGLVPLCHGIIPFIYLWGNRNYHEAIKTSFLWCRLRQGRVRPN